MFIGKKDKGLVVITKKDFDKLNKAFDAISEELSMIRIDAMSLKHDDGHPFDYRDKDMIEYILRRIEAGHIAVNEVKDIRYIQ